MPFGLTAAPVTFQRLADSVFGPELFPEVVVFLDDILICSSNFESHCRAITEVFKRLKLLGLNINPEKCEFGCREVHYLGYRINIDGMSVDPEKVAPVLSFPRPKTAKEIRRFLGMASWYLRFVPDFSTLVTPLTSLLKKGAKWHGVKLRSHRSGSSSIPLRLPLSWRARTSLPPSPSRRMRVMLVVVQSLPRSKMGGSA
jgi:hypothetical protein